MKKIITVLVSVLLCVSAAFPVFAEELDFSKCRSEDAYALITEGEYEVYPDQHPVIKGNFNEGMSFGFKTSFSEHDWININFMNDASFPEKNNGYLGNKGLTLLIFLSDISVEARIVTDGEGIGWDNPYAAFKSRVEDIDYFGDKQWHKVTMSHTNGTWTLTVDGVNLFDGITEDQSAALDTFVGGDVGYISFGSTSGQGQYMICSGSYADERIAEQTKAPEVSDETPVTFAPEPTVETEPKADTTNKPAATDGQGDKPGASNGNTAIYIIAAVIAVAAVAVIIALIAKSKKK
jgi:hypothetical protein